MYSSEIAVRVSVFSVPTGTSLLLRIVYDATRFSAPMSRAVIEVTDSLKVLSLPASNRSVWPNSEVSLNFHLYRSAPVPIVSFVLTPSWSSD